VQVDYEDVVDSAPLLQVLEIDLAQIVRTVVWVLVFPWTSLCNLSMVERLPFTEDSHEARITPRAIAKGTNADSTLAISSPQFWGPFIVVILYGMVLLWGEFKVIAQHIYYSGSVIYSTFPGC
jgi:hypothetical protein